MSRNLYVDDCRTCPEGWDLARNYDEAIAMLETRQYDLVSLDHDIASYRADGREMTGYDIALWMAAEKNEGRRVPEMVLCHSQNAPGKRNILSVVDRYLQPD